MFLTNSMRHFAHKFDQQNGAGYLLVETISSREKTPNPLVHRNPEERRDCSASLVMIYILITQ